MTSWENSESYAAEYFKLLKLNGQKFTYINILCNVNFMHIW